MPQCSALLVVPRVAESFSFTSGDRRVAVCVWFLAVS